jgi:hypothetical protein
VLEEWVHEARSTATGLRNTLDKIFHRIDSELRRDDFQGIRLYRRGLFRDAITIKVETQDRLRSNIIPDAQEMLKRLTEELNWIVPPRRKGNTRGHSSYPGLADLVYGLELCARLNGGGFTLHRKDKGARGNLIEALDWLRHRFAETPELKHLARYLPAPGRHPVRTYQAAIGDARKAARRRPAGITNPKSGS